jgi:predicted AAA+ superfamily ATPase
MQQAKEITGVMPKYVFFDEVQKVGDWPGQAKRIYDLHGTKMFVTGSQSLFLRKAGQESLAGRMFEFEMKPLSFREYLSFRGIENTPLYEEEIKKSLYHYLLTFGLPELVAETDVFFIRKYVKEGLVDKAVYHDIPARFHVDAPSLLESILNRIIGCPGLLLDKNGLAAELGVSRATSANYLYYLESAFLIRSLYNYSRNRSTSEKKLKKYYPCFPVLCFGPKDDSTYQGKVAEAAAVQNAGAKFFWRSQGGDEVDIVLEEPLRPIEVKYRENPAELKGMEKFAKKFKTGNGTVITKDEEKTIGKIKYVPLWKWLLEK